MKFNLVTIRHVLDQGRPNLFGKGPSQLLWACLRTARLKITSGIPNRVNVCAVLKQINNFHWPHNTPWNGAGF
jgi:hypothetical protein